MNKSAFERKPVSGAETAARRLDPAPLEASGTFLNAAGLVLEDVSGSRVVGHIEIGPGRYTPWGIVHGGVYTTAVESAASIGASAAVRDQGMVAVGLTNTTHSSDHAERAQSESRRWPSTRDAPSSSGE